MTQPFDPEPPGPIVSESSSGRGLKIAGLAVAVIAVAVAVVFVTDSGGDDDGVAASKVGEVIDSDPAADEGAGETSESPATTEEAESAPTTAPAGPVDLFADASKPFGAFAEIYDTPINVYEIVVYPDWAYITVQVPEQPTYVDEYTWRGGDGVSGPEEGDVFDESELPEKWFDLTEIDPATIPGVVEQALAQFPGDGGEPSAVTHIIIDRFLPFDTRVLFRVYVDEGGRGDGGYVTFTTDGGFVETVA